MPFHIRNRHTSFRDETPGRLDLLLLALYGAGLLVSCGAMGPPKPPRVERPEPVKDLAAAQVGAKLEISFTLPELAADGERLTKQLEVQIFRTLAPAGQRPEEPKTAEPWVTLKPGDLSKYAPGEKIEYAGQLSNEDYRQPAGSTLTFVVRTLTRGFRGHPVVSEASNIAQVGMVDVSSPPSDLQARTTEKAIELSWTKPAATLGGQPVTNLSGYRVYRRDTAMSTFELRGETATPAYFDAEFKFGHTYSYKVRAVFRRDGQSAESDDSEAREITPSDTFPPATPSGLNAVYAGPVVEIIWTANTEPDLAGYNLYRREEAGTFGRINKELIITPIARDPAVEAGRKYFYRVTAVDLAGNESPPSEEAEAR